MPLHRATREKDKKYYIINFVQKLLLEKISSVTIKILILIYTYLKCRSDWVCIKKNKSSTRKV